MSTSLSRAKLDALYQELILDHYRRPRNRGELPDASVHAAASNPLCGDAVAVALAFGADDRVRAARFTGQGCSIAQASASMLTELVVGRTRAELTALRARVGALVAGDPAAAADATLGDLRALAGVARFPARVKCATLAWEALGRGLAG